MLNIYFLIFIFMIPILNLLFGAMVGLQLLLILLAQRRFMRILAGLLLSVMWFAGSCYWMLLGKSFAGSVALLVLLIVSTLGLFNLVGKVAPGYQKQLTLANAANLGNFSFDCAFGEFNTSTVVCVDNANKKLAFIGENYFRIEPLSFIESWELNWTDVSNSNGNIRSENPYITLHTQDFKSPVIRIIMPSKQVGEAWVQRLKLMTDVKT